jgi:hypothetical protein
MTNKLPLDVAAEQAIDLMRRYGEMDREKQKSFARAYHVAKEHLEKTLGQFDDWKKDDQLEAASTLMNKARKATEAEPNAAMGIALLSLFFQINTETGTKAVQHAMDIEKWYQEAIERDLRETR